MTDTVIHLIGNVGTDVDYRLVGGGTDLSTFRLATTPRRWDRNQRTYVDGVTNWLSVQCWRSLAVHVRDSLSRGDPVVVVGKLRTQEWEQNGSRVSKFVVEATAVGHDLSRGVSSFRKAPRSVVDRQGGVGGRGTASVLSAGGPDPGAAGQAGAAPTPPLAEAG